MKMFVRVLIAIAGVAIVLGGLGTIKGLQIERMMAHSEAFVPSAQTVAAASVMAAQWKRTLPAVGSLEAVQGVTVTAELPGKATAISITPGSRVEAGQLLLQQDVSEERARLKAVESRLHLAAKDLARARQLHAERVVTDSSLDQAQAAHDQALAEKQTLQAIIAKKTIRAPFAGRLGIRQVNLGEFLEPGQPLVSLQSLDSLYVNFRLPQQRLEQLETGLPVEVRSTGNLAAPVEGRITAVNPKVNAETRNVHVQATVKNADEQLRPGMFVRVQVILPDGRPVLTIPATAVHYAPYGDTVFVIESKTGDAGATETVLRQQFVQLGGKRGDFVAVVSGLQAGQQVVSTGVFKLRNNMPVVVDNTLAPAFEIDPQPENA